MTRNEADALLLTGARTMLDFIRKRAQAGDAEAINIYNTVAHTRVLAIAYEKRWRDNQTAQNKGKVKK